MKASLGVTLAVNAIALFAAAAFIAPRAGRARASMGR